MRGLQAGKLLHFVRMISWDHVEGKSSLRWYRLVKEEFGVEGYLKVFDVRLRFRLRTGSGGLLEDKKRGGGG